MSKVGDTGTIAIGTMKSHEVWVPTMELRWFERTREDRNFIVTRTVLQQRWIRQGGHEMSLGGIEWRDIPIVTEEQV
jgi:hypothetical protein